VNYKPASINLKLASLKSLFSRIETLYNVKNPFGTLKALKTKTTFKVNQRVEKETTLNKLEITALFQHYRNMLKNNDKRISQFSIKRNLIMLELLYGHGCRASEVINIKYSDIQKESEGLYYIELSNCKGDKTRKLKIDGVFYAEIMDLHQGEDDYILRSMQGKKITRTFIYSEITKRTAKILNHKVSPHQLRHSFATTMIANHPEMLKGISEYIGHESPAFTIKVYVHNSLTSTQLKEMRI
jgi:integrase